MENQRPAKVFQGVTLEEFRYLTRLLRREFGNKVKTEYTQHPGSPSQGVFQYSVSVLPAEDPEFNATTLKRLAEFLSKNGFDVKYVNDNGTIKKISDTNFIDTPLIYHRYKNGIISLYRNSNVDFDMSMPIDEIDITPQTIKPPAVPTTVKPPVSKPSLTAPPGFGNLPPAPPLTSKPSIPTTGPKPPIITPGVKPPIAPSVKPPVVEKPKPKKMGKRIDDALLDSLLNGEGGIKSYLATNSLPVYASISYNEDDSLNIEFKDVVDDTVSLPQEHLDWVLAALNNFSLLNGSGENTLTGLFDHYDTGENEEVVQEVIKSKKITKAAPKSTLDSLQFHEQILPENVIEDVQFLLLVNSAKNELGEEHSDIYNQGLGLLDSKKKYLLNFVRNLPQDVYGNVHGMKGIYKKIVELKRESNIISECSSFFPILFNKSEDNNDLLDNAFPHPANVRARFILDNMGDLKSLCKLSFTDPRYIEYQNELIRTLGLQISPLEKIEVQTKTAEILGSRINILDRNIKSSFDSNIKAEYENEKERILAYANTQNEAFKAIFVKTKTENKYVVVGNPLLPFSKEQEGAILAQGNTVIAAGAGSGKTRVLAAKVVHAIKDLGIPPKKIIATSFTEKSSTELKERCVRYYLDLVGGDLEAMGGDKIGKTTHSISFKLLTELGVDYMAIPFKGDPSGNDLLFDIAYRQIGFLKDEKIKEKKEFEEKETETSGLAGALLKYLNALNKLKKEINEKEFKEKYNVTKIPYIIYSIKKSPVKPFLDYYIDSLKRYNQLFDNTIDAIREIYLLVGPLTLDEEAKKILDKRFHISKEALLVLGAKKKLTPEEVAKGKQFAKNYYDTKDSLLMLKLAQSKYLEYPAGKWFNIGAEIYKEEEDVGNAPEVNKDEAGEDDLLEGKDGLKEEKRDIESIMEKYRGNYRTHIDFFKYEYLYDIFINEPNNALNELLTAQIPNLTQDNIKENLSKIDNNLLLSSFDSFINSEDGLLHKSLKKVKAFCVWAAYDWLKSNEPGIKEVAGDKKVVDSTDCFWELGDRLRDNPSMLNKVQNSYTSIFVDEAQDLNNSQHRAFSYMAGLWNPKTDKAWDIAKDGPIKTKTRMYSLIGDDRQCCSENTLISTNSGAKIAKDIVAGDGILSYRNGKIVEQKVRYVKKTSWEYGFKITTESGKTLTMSPNHKIWASTPLISKNQMIIYLMYRSDMGFRIGITNKGLSERLGDFGNRCNAEHAERLWVVDICDSRTGAEFKEYSYSLNYAIPTTVFNAKNRGLDVEKAGRIFKAFGNNGYKLLNDKHMSFDYPNWISTSYGKYNTNRITINITAHTNNSTQVEAIWQKSENINILEAKPHKNSSMRIRKYFANYREALIYAETLKVQLNTNLVKERIKVSDNYLNLVTASTLCPGMCIISKEGDGIFEDRIVSVEQVSDNFIDLDVDDASNFFGNDILSHNSIYSWRSANPDEFKNRALGDTFTLNELSTNYRSESTIVETAQRLISFNGDAQLPIECKASPLKGKGKIYHKLFNDYEELCEFITKRTFDYLQQGIAKSDNEFGVIVRNNSELAKLEPFAWKYGEEYHIKKSILSNETIKSVMNWVVLISTTDIVEKNQMLKKCCTTPYFGFSGNDLNAAITAAGIYNTADWVEQIKYRQYKLFFGRDLYKNDKLRNFISQVDKLIAFKNKMGTADLPYEIVKEVLRIQGDKDSFVDLFTSKKKKRKNLSADMEISVNEDEANRVSRESGKAKEDSPDLQDRDPAIEKLINKELFLNMRILLNSKPNLGEGVKYYSSIKKRLEENKKEDSMLFSTSHSWKGLEKNYVFVIMNEHFGVSDALSEVRKEKGELTERELKEVNEEQRRLAYVAITRGAKEVVVCGSKINHLGKENGVSSFIYEMGLPDEEQRDAGYEFINYFEEGAPQLAYGENTEELKSNARLPKITSDKEMKAEYPDYDQDFLEQQVWFRDIEAAYIPFVLNATSLSYKTMKALFSNYGDVFVEAETHIGFPNFATHILTFNINKNYSLYLSVPDVANPTVLKITLADASNRDQPLLNKDGRDVLELKFTIKSKVPALGLFEALRPTLRRYGLVK